MKARTKRTPLAARGPLYVVDPLTPTALTGNVDNYSPDGLSEATVVRLDGGLVDITITGLAGGAEGRLLTIMNVGLSNSINLANQSLSSSAANRFIGPNGQAIAIRYGGACTLLYDSVSSRWRVFSVSSLA